MEIHHCYERNVNPCLHKDMYVLCRVTFAITVFPLVILKKRGMKHDYIVLYMISRIGK